LSPDQEPDHWILSKARVLSSIRLFAGVSLDYYNGAQPDVLVFVPRTDRANMCGFTRIPSASIENCIAANETAARLTNPSATCIGISLKYVRFG